MAPRNNNVASGNQINHKWQSKGIWDRKNVTSDMARGPYLSGCETCCFIVSRHAMIFGNGGGSTAAYVKHSI